MRLTETTKRMTDNSSNRPVSLRDLEQLLNAVSTGSFYVKPDEYRHITGLGRTQFYYLKKSGRFDAGIHLATLGGRYVLIHKMHSGRIGISGLDYTEPITPTLRGKNVEATKKAT